VILSTILSKLQRTRRRPEDCAEVEEPAGALSS
jgi:hypothetical protein